MPVALYKERMHFLKHLPTSEMDDLRRQIEDEIASLIDLSKSTIDATICRQMRHLVAFESHAHGLEQRRMR